MERDQAALRHRQRWKFVAHKDGLTFGNFHVL